MEHANDRNNRDALELVSIRTLARMWDVKEATLRRWARERHIKARKIGKSWRFAVSDLRALLESGGPSR